MRVLFSVTDKTHLAAFGKGLLKIFPKLQIIASGGTADLLQNEGIPHTPISKVTQFPECFGGRVKTLHPVILGGILFRRGIDDLEAKNLDITPIDLVVCNLYHFDPNQEMPPLVESIDIGGSTMIRAAVKNYISVGIVVDPNDYMSILDELSMKGSLSLQTRHKLAAKAIQMSAQYESSIANAFSGKSESLFQLEKGRKLSYGENPDQEGWVYSFSGEDGIASAKVFGEKALSYNNYEDASQAFFALQRIADSGKVAAVAIVKHGGLSGFATGKSLRAAFQRAWEADAKSAYGSIVAFSQEVGEEFCEVLKGRFMEVLVAPSFTSSFIRWVSEAKPLLRLLQLSLDKVPSRLYRGISGGMLVQTPKENLESNIFVQPLTNKIGVATKRFPKEQQIGLFRFALAAVQSVKSNAIVLAREYEPTFYQTIGIGGGQPNRIDSLQRLALPKALENLEQEYEKDQMQQALGELVLASDGFFPFADSVRAAADAGIQFFVQPGGSLRDEEVIQEADQRDICMIFTRERYFSH